MPPTSLARPYLNRYLSSNTTVYLQWSPIAGAEHWELSHQFYTKAGSGYSPSKDISVVDTNIPGDTTSYVVDLPELRDEEREIHGFILSARNQCYTNDLSFTVSVYADDPELMLSIIRIMDTSMRLYWTLSNYKVDTYQLECSLDGESWLVLAPNLSSYTNQYDAIDLTPGTWYVFRLTGKSPLQDIAALATGTTYPLGEHLEIWAEDYDYYYVQLIWLTLSDAQAWSIHYRLYIGTEWTIAASLLPKSDLTYTVTGLSPETRYAFRLLAHRGEEVSSVDCVATTSGIRRPPEVSSSFDADTVMNLTLYATVPVARHLTGWRITVAGKTVNIDSSSSSISYTADWLQPSTTYTFDVCVFYADNEVLCTRHTVTTRDVKYCDILQVHTTSSTADIAVNWSGELYNFQYWEVTIDREAFGGSNGVSKQSGRIYDPKAVYTFSGLSPYNDISLIVGFGTVFDAYTLTVSVQYANSIRCEQIKSVSIIPPLSVKASARHIFSCYVTWTGGGGGRNPATCDNVTQRYRVSYKRKAETNWLVAGYSTRDLRYITIDLMPAASYDIKVEDLCYNEEATTTITMPDWTVTYDSDLSTDSCIVVRYEELPSSLASSLDRRYYFSFPYQGGTKTVAMVPNPSGTAYPSGKTSLAYICGLSCGVKGTVTASIKDIRVNGNLAPTANPSLWGDIYSKRIDAHTKNCPGTPSEPEPIAYRIANLTVMGSSYVGVKLAWDVLPSKEIAQANNVTYAVAFTRVDTAIVQFTRSTFFLVQAATPGRLNVCVAVVSAGSDYGSEINGTLQDVDIVPSSKVCVSIQLPPAYVSG
jgi:hypothetical protein